MDDRDDRSASAHTPGYQPHLDGVRAVAVYLVVAFHAGVDRLNGGFIGVDVFFVLSGYLVTRTLLARRESTGAMGFGHFYARRVRRLLPAASVSLAVTAIVFRWMASPAEAATASRSIRAAALYLSNWWFIREDADYFGTAIESSPVLHYWSLSVEEQFYVLWPLVLGGLLWLAARFAGAGSRRFVAAMVVLGSLASLTGALWIERTDLARAYYGSDTRAYQLLAGAALALLPGLVARAARTPGARLVLPAASAVGLGGILVLASSSLTLSPVRRGAVTTVLILVLLVSLQSGHRDPVGWLLARSPVTYLGRISYGTYLWHWIVSLVAIRELELSPLPTVVLTAVVASAIAALSFELLEQPIRLGVWSPRLDRPTVVGGLALSLLVGVVVAPWILRQTDSVDVAGSSTTVGTPVALDLDAEVAAAREAYIDCSIDTGDPCVVHDGSGSKILLVGDSHALMLAPAFALIAEESDLHVTASTMRYCPWIREIAYFFQDPDRCYRLQERVLDEAISEVDPDVVVLAHRAVDDPANPMDLLQRGRGRLEPGPERQELVAEITQRVVANIRDDGRRVVLVEPTPLPSPLTSMLDCLSEATYLEECRRVAEVGPTPQEEVMRSLGSEHDDVWAMDLDLLACPYLPICDPVVNGQVVSFDGSHLTATFVETLADGIARYLDMNQVLDDLQPL